MGLQMCTPVFRSVDPAFMQPSLGLRAFPSIWSGLQASLRAILGQHQLISDDQQCPTAEAPVDRHLWLYLDTSTTKIHV